MKKLQERKIECYPTYMEPTCQIVSSLTWSSSKCTFLAYNTVSKIYNDGIPSQNIYRLQVSLMIMIMHGTLTCRPWHKNLIALGGGLRWWLGWGWRSQYSHHKERRKWNSPVLCYISQGEGALLSNVTWIHQFGLRQQNMNHKQQFKKSK